jgi:nitroreductase
MDVLECIATRRSAPILVEPAPDAPALRRLLEAAVAAPDHGRLRPWRFVIVRGAARERLGSALAAAQADRDPSATPNALARTRAKPLRAPLIIVVICAPKPYAKVPVWEQVASAACAVQHIQLAAHALGYGSMWRTGWAVHAEKVRAHLGCAGDERIVALLYLGTVPEGVSMPPRARVCLDGLVIEQ